MSWETKHSVIVKASLSKAWEFHTNIEKYWDKIEGDSVEYIKLLGPYKSGTKGQTKMKGQPPTDWQLIEVEPLSKSITEMLLPDACLHFTFIFEALSEDQTKLTQKISLSGEGASEYLSVMEENFGKNLEAGMEKIAKEMENFAKK